jgi:hypothetical protein
MNEQPSWIQFLKLMEQSIKELKALKKAQKELAASLIVQPPKRIIREESEKPEAHESGE